MTFDTWESYFYPPPDEGNGRTGKVFMEHVAERSRFALDFGQVTPDVWNQASQLSRPDMFSYDPEPASLVPVFRVIATTPMGRALFGIVAVFAQLRVDTIRDNTRRGLAHARAQGRVGGRPSVMTPERVKAAVKMREQDMSIPR